MGMFFNVQLNSLDDLLLLQLNDLYDAEKRLCDALPEMAQAASSSVLKEAFRSHFEQTKRQVSRLEQIFVDLGRSSSRETCDAMKGLIKEGSEIVSAEGHPDVKDAALIAAAQRVEHYEIAGYGSARAVCPTLGPYQCSPLAPIDIGRRKGDGPTIDEIGRRAYQHPGRVHVLRRG